MYSEETLRNAYDRGYQDAVHFLYNPDGYGENNALRDAYEAGRADARRHFGDDR